MPEVLNQASGQHCCVWSGVWPLSSVISLVPSWLGVPFVSSHQSGLQLVQSFLPHALNTNFPCIVGEHSYLVRTSAQRNRAVRRKFGARDWWPAFLPQDLTLNKLLRSMFVLCSLQCLSCLPVSRDLSDWTRPGASCIQVWRELKFSSTLSSAWWWPVLLNDTFVFTWEITPLPLHAGVLLIHMPCPPLMMWSCTWAPKEGQCPTGSLTSCH